HPALHRTRKQPAAAGTPSNSKPAAKETTMKPSSRTRLIAPAAIVLALSAVGAGAAGTQPYKPFVTDFPKPAVSAEHRLCPHRTRTAAALYRSRVFPVSSRTSRP